MPSPSKAAKKPYRSPSLAVLDLSAVKAKLNAKGEPNDEIVRKMLSLIDEELNKGEARLHSLRGADHRER